MQPSHQLVALLDLVVAHQSIDGAPVQAMQLAIRHQVPLVADHLEEFNDRPVLWQYFDVVAVLPALDDV